MRNLFTSVFAILPIFLCVHLSSLNAQTEKSFPKDLAPGQVEKKPALRKFESGLQQVYDYHQIELRTAAAPESVAPLPDVLMIYKERIAVDLIARTSTAALLEELTALDFEERATFGKTISGKIHLDDLEQLNDLEHLQYARPVYKPHTHVGSVDSQGDVAQYTDVARTTYNVDGAGLKIGAMSDSYNTLSGEATGIASGDLPGPGNPNGYTTPVTVLLDYSSTGSDEARGMIEIIHDVAPAAQIYARTAFEGIADFAQGILDLAAAGCNIIVDDISYFAEPFFQEGDIAQAVNQVVRNNGVVYFTSAGNMGRKSYESAGFTNSGTNYGGGPIHDFDPGVDVDYGQSITIPAGQTLTMTLQWDDPFGSLPNSVGSANTDLDVFFFNSTYSTRLAAANTTNTSTGDPYEIISYTNNTPSAVAINLVITHYAGSAPGYMKYLCWNNNVTIDEYDTRSSTIVGHANAKESIAAGAAAWYNTPAYGASPPAINSFSSAGGTPVFFDSVGNPITTLYREKPELVGPDGTNTTFFGTDITQDADSYPNFFGTSASAPHLAGAGALLMEMGATSRADILDALINTTDDMDDPSTGGMDSGFDYGTGYGMAQVNAAIAYFVSLPVELLEFSIRRSSKSGGELYWSTAAELNNKRFIIEQQSGNGAFQRIATVVGLGNTQTVNHYQHRVSNLSPGTHYFRLLQEDLDGTITKHGIVSLEVEGKTNQVWTFKEASNQQVIAVNSAQNAMLTIYVYSASGQLLKSVKAQTNKGERYTTELSTEDWIRGTYFYQVEIGSGTSESVYAGKFVL